MCALEVDIRRIGASYLPLGHKRKVQHDGLTGTIPSIRDTASRREGQTYTDDLSTANLPRTADDREHQ